MRDDASIADPGFGVYIEPGNERARRPDGSQLERTISVVRRRGSCGRATLGLRPGRPSLLQQVRTPRRRSPRVSGFGRETRGDSEGCGTDFGSCTRPCTLARAPNGQPNPRSKASAERRRGGDPTGGARTSVRAPELASLARAPNGQPNPRRKASAERRRGGDSKGGARTSVRAPELVTVDEGAPTVNTWNRAASAGRRRVGTRRATRELRLEHPSRHRLRGRS